MNKKLAPLLLLGVLLVPTVTHASWWNPFSWFKKKATVPVVQVQQAVPTVAPVVTIPIPASIESKEKIKTNSSLNKESVKNTVAPQVVPVQPTVPAPVTAPVVNVPVPVVQLAISNVSVVPAITSAQISWDTNITSESKVILNGVEYPSQQGVGTYHSVTINNLSGGLTYQGVITALANNAWTNLSVTIITNPAPVIVPAPTPVTPTVTPSKGGHSTSA